MGHPLNLRGEEERRSFLSRKKLFSGGQILNSRSFNEPTTIESWIDGDTVGQSRYAKSVGSTAGSRYGNDRSRLRMLVRERVIFRPSPSLSLLH